MLPIFQWNGPSGNDESGYMPAHWRNFFTGDIYQSPNWYYVGQSGDPESGIESAHYVNALTGESVGVDDLYASPYAPGSPPLTQQYGTAESVRAYGGYDRFTGLIGADGYPQNKQDVLDAETARRNADSSVWAQVGPGIVNTALFVGTVLGAEALYNYATGPVLPEATSVPDFTSADELLSMPEASVQSVPSMPEYSAFEDMPVYDASLDPAVSVPDFTSADEALNVSESFTQEAQTLATENIAAPAVQQAAQQTVAASTAAATAAQSGSTAATIKGYLSAAAAALTLTRQAVNAYRNPTYGGQINPATGQPYGAINPATGQPYGFTQASPYGTSGQSLLLPLAAIAALVLLKG